MKILFLHLSDLHIKNNDAYNEFQIKKLVDSLQVATPFDKLIIIFSGDIAFSGIKEQYDVADKIINKIYSDMKDQNIYNGEKNIICVPGNHDIKYENPPRNSNELNQIFKEYSYKKYLNSELEKQNHFFEFALKYNCFTKNKLLCQNFLIFDNFKIELNLLNTGVFSLMKEEDKGLHYIEQADINKINIPTESDFVISIMHHSYDWYIDSQKEQLEKALLCKSSLLFLGHEHRIGTKQSSYNNSESVFIHAGGALCDNDDWSLSEFEFGVFNTESYNYSSFQNKWDSNENQYSCIKKYKKVLPHKPSKEKRLTIREEYKTKLLLDPFHEWTKNFMDYFVFPRIETEKFDNLYDSEFLNIDLFMKEICKQKRVLITGATNCGKTTLLKALLLKFAEEKCVIFCDINTIKNKPANKIIKSNFIEIYGEDSASYTRYQQLPPEKRVLIIDNIDQIKTTDFDHYISEVNRDFGIMIFSTKKIINLDIIEQIKARLKYENAITAYRITPFFSDKRQELIRKLVEIKHKENKSIDVDKVTEILCDSIKHQKNFISLDPDFIINFVNYYCNNIGNALNCDSTIFSKIFESNITSALSPYMSNILTIEKIYRLLSKTAYHIHFNKKYPISEDDIFTIIKDYNVKNDDDVNPNTFISIAKKSKLLFSEEGKNYKFVNRNQLAYFVAKEVNFLYNQTGNENDLTYLLQNACFGINADILLFISYITDNTRILGFLLNTIQSFTENWRELNFETNMPKFLELHQVPEVELLSESDKKRIEEKEIYEEKTDSKQLATIDIYDYNEDDALEPINQIIRAISLLAIISKCLPSFEHNMTAEMKHSFVKEVYVLPNKIYNSWAEVVEKSYDIIVKELKREKSVEYENTKEQLKLDKFHTELQLIAISLLLDIYNVSAINATKDNSFRLLDKFDRESKPTYEILHLMILRRQKKSKEFVNEAITMNNNYSNNILLKTLIKCIVSHAMIYMDSLNLKKRDQLKSEFFPTVIEQKTLLLNRDKLRD